MKTLGWICAALRVFCAVLLVCMVFLVIVQVVSRYVFSAPVDQTEELSRYAMVWAALLGASVAIFDKSHVAVTLLTDRAPAGLRRVFAAFVHLCIAVFCLLLIWHGWRLTQRSMIQWSTTLPIRMGYVTFVVPLCGAFGLLFTLRNFVADLIGGGKGDAA